MAEDGGEAGVEIAVLVEWVGGEVVEDALRGGVGRTRSVCVCGW